MKAAKILQILKEHEEELARLGVQSLALFGSIARGEATAESDVDILVKFSTPVTFDKYMDTRLFLEDLLECPVDLIVESAIRPRIRPYVEQDAIYVS